MFFPAGEGSVAFNPLAVSFERAARRSVASDTDHLKVAAQRPSISCGGPIPPSLNLKPSPAACLTRMTPGVPMPTWGAHLAVFRPADVSRSMKKLSMGSRGGVLIIVLVLIMVAAALTAGWVSVMTSQIEYVDQVSAGRETANWRAKCHGIGPSAYSLQCPDKGKCASGCR